jgi:hypothetical protein
MPFDPTTFELGDVLAETQLGRLTRGWKLPLLLRKRLARLKRFYGA